MKVNSFTPATKGDFAAACQKVGLKPNKTSLKKLLEVRDEIFLPNSNIPIFELYCRRNGLNPQAPDTFESIKKISDNKPMTYMLNDIIG